MQSLRQVLDAAASVCRDDPDEAAVTIRRGLLAYPREASVWDLMARIQLVQGRTELAWENYAHAQDLVPPGADDPTVEGLLLRRIVCADLMPGLEPEAHGELRTAWMQTAAADAPPRRRPRRPYPDRPLRVGIASASIGKSAGMASYRGLFEWLGKFDALAVYAYCDTREEVQDVVSAHVRTCVGADRWRDTARMNNAAWSRTIADDNIDILIDCLEYDGADRLRAMAQRPAPVLVGHISGLRLPFLDFFLGEGMGETPGAPLAAPVIGYQPLVRGAITERPERPFTYGYMGRPSKINTAVLGWWGAILAAAPETRLVLKDARYPKSEHLRDWILAGLGVAVDRVTFLGATDHLVHVNHYNDIDLALDSWPWTGGITTLEALHAGCPVVSLSTEEFFARQGGRILSALDLGALVMDTAQRYAELAAAASRGTVMNLDDRLELRGRLEGSILYGERYVQTVAAALRAAWREACTWPAA